MSPFSKQLFTYGSLMCEDIMTEVTGSHLKSTPACLSGYRRFLVKNEKYPGIVPAASGLVNGVVYHGLNQAHWRRLDQFEGEYYDRQPVSVLLDDGQDLTVDCYLFRPELGYLLTEIEWDFTTFLDQGKTIFQHQYCGFKAID